LRVIFECKGPNFKPSLQKKRKLRCARWFAQSRVFFLADTAVSLAPGRDVCLRRGPPHHRKHERGGNCFHAAGACRRTGPPACTQGCRPGAVKWVCCAFRARLWGGSVSLSVDSPSCPACGAFFCSLTCVSGCVGRLRVRFAARSRPLFTPETGRAIHGQTNLTAKLTPLALSSIRG
jgi:hypothetical protein